MERTDNGKPTTAAVTTGRELIVRPPLNEYALQRSEGAQRCNGKRDAVTPRKVKSKNRRPSLKHSPPAPPKAMWPVFLMFAGAVLYFISPIDLIPDFLLGPGQFDDIALFYGAYRQWKSRKEHNSKLQEFHREPDDRFTSAERLDDRRAVNHRDWDNEAGLLPPYLRARPLPEREEPGFFGRLWKASMYIFNGGGM